MPSDIIFLSKIRPQLSRLEGLNEEGILLVFDHDTAGYRKAYKWISKNWDRDVPLFRLLIPCGGPGIRDLSDLERVRRQAPPGPQHTGYIDRSPDGTPFRAEQIIWDEIDGMPDTMEWPGEPDPLGPGKVSLSTIFRCAFCSDRHLRYPNIYTGLTAIQQFILDRATERSATMHELVAYAAAHFHVEYDVAAEQYEMMTFGNLPPLTSPAGPSCFSRVGEQDSSIPRWLINGPIPFDPKDVRANFVTMIRKGEDKGDWENMRPSCHPFTFTPATGGWFSNSPEVIGGIRPPYGWTMSKFLERFSEQPDSSWASIQCHPESLKLKLNLTFHDPESTKLAQFPSIRTYAMQWFELKLRSMVRTGHARSFFEKRMEQKYNYLRSIYAGRTFTYKATDDEDNPAIENRVFIDEELPQKQKRLLDEYGPDHFEYLMSLKIWELGPTTFYEDDIVPKGRAFASDRWLVELGAQPSDA